MTRRKTAAQERPVRYIPPRVLAMAREQLEWSGRRGASAAPAW